VRRAPLLALLVLALAGCAAPAQDPAGAEGPIDLSGRLGLMLVDVESRSVLLYGERATLGWMSPNATVVTWMEEDYAIVHDRTTGARDIGAPTVWARVHDNGTGLELAEEEARLRQLVGVDVLQTTPLPPPPRVGARWTGASADLGVLVGEYLGAQRGGCRNDLYIRSPQLERSIGCHLRVADDGRVGWTEGTSVRVRERDGTLRNLTGPGSGDASNGTFVGHENPVFTEDGVLMLRLTGGLQLRLSEIVDEEGNVLAKADGPRRLALLDASADGRHILVRAFDR